MIVIMHGFDMAYDFQAPEFGLCFCIVRATMTSCAQVWDTSGLVQRRKSSSQASTSALEARAAVAAHDKEINAVALSPNDALVCSASQDRTAKVPSA